MLLKLFLKVLQNIKYNYLTTASQRLEMSDLIAPNSICFQTQKITRYLKNIGLLLKDVLIDLSARINSLRARFVHVRYRAHNLSSPV